MKAKWKVTKEELPKKRGQYLCYIFYPENSDPYYEFSVEWFDYQKEHIKLNDQETIIRTSKGLSFNENWKEIIAWRHLPEEPERFW